MVEEGRNRGRDLEAGKVVWRMTREGARLQRGDVFVAEKGRGRKAASERYRGTWLPFCPFRLVAARVLAPAALFCAFSRFPSSAAAETPQLPLSRAGLVRCLLPGRRSNLLQGLSSHCNPGAAPCGDAR